MTLATPASPFRFDADTEGRREAKVRSELEEKLQRQGPLRCAVCRAPITDRNAGIVRGGMHAHRFANPGGYTFHIGCFEDAPGCGHMGDEISEHTWFPGYAWTVALCAACGTHLGWRFRGPGDRFYGLILDRLVSAEDD